MLGLGVFQSWLPFWVSHDSPLLTRILKKQLLVAEPSFWDTWELIEKYVLLVAWLLHWSSGLTPDTIWVWEWFLTLRILLGHQQNNQINHHLYVFSLISSLLLSTLMTSDFYKWQFLFWYHLIKDPCIFNKISQLSSLPWDRGSWCKPLI